MRRSEFIVFKKLRSNISRHFLFWVRQFESRVWRKVFRRHKIPPLHPMGLLTDTQNCELRMRRECQERFPRHRGLAIPVTHCTSRVLGSMSFIFLTFEFLNVLIVKPEFLSLCLRTLFLGYNAVKVEPHNIRWRIRYLSNNLFCCLWNIIAI